MTDERLRILERRCLESPVDENIIAFMQEKVRSGDQSIFGSFWRFLNGHWTLTAPEREGLFLLATREGYCCGYNLAVMVCRDPERGWQGVRGNYSRNLHETWQGYWWSEPLPEMPLAPCIMPSTTPRLWVQWIETWHCSACDEDLPHQTARPQDDDLGGVKTTCSKCTRETWR